MTPPGPTTDRSDESRKFASGAGRHYLWGSMSEAHSACRSEMPEPLPSAEQLLAAVYVELRQLAAKRMERESVDQTLQPTALVHEAWLQLSGDGERAWQSRAHFFGAAADAMRRIMVDKARSKARLKRGAGKLRLDIEEADIASSAPDGDVLAINEALEKLERQDPAQARIVVLKFFGGLTNEEVAEALGIGERTVYRQWVCAKARLFSWVSAEK
jgi:RNA polymerase sigma factor (TIGR02999 family)